MGQSEKDPIEEPKEQPDTEPAADEPTGEGDNN